MKDFKNIKEELSDIRRDIISYINTQEEEQDLMDKFIKVKEKDEATYELIMLIYQELKTTHKLNKKKLTQIIDKAIEIKIKAIDKIIEDKLNNKLQDNSSGDLVDKFIGALTFKNIVRGVGLWMFIFLFLFTLYSINSDAFTNAHKSIIDTVEVTKERVE